MTKQQWQFKRIREEQTAQRQVEQKVKEWSWGVIQEEGSHKRSEFLLSEELYSCFRGETNYSDIFKRMLLCAYHSQGGGQKKV